MQQTDLAGLNEQEERRLRDAGFQLEQGDDLRRWNRLEGAYFSSGLWESAGGREVPQFACSSAEACNALFCSVEKNKGKHIRPDHRGTIANYFSAGYDRLRTRDGTHVRICVVSIDSGGWTFDFRTQTKLDKLNQLDWENPHWQATRDVLYHLLFQKWPSEMRQTALCPKLFTHVRALKCNGGNEPRPRLDHVLDSFAAGYHDSGKRWSVVWRPNASMYSLCNRHLMAELDALEPTVVIAQGFSTHSECTTSSVIKAMDCLCQEPGADVGAQVYACSRTPVDVAARYWSAPWGPCALIGTYHPSYWLHDPHGLENLRRALEPGMKWLRDVGLTG